MGPVKSVTYNVADEEAGESEKLLNLDFKSSASKSRDRIKACFNQLSEQDIHKIMSDPENANLKKAYDTILEKYSNFPLNKQEYEPFINDTLSETSGANG